VNNKGWGLVEKGKPSKEAGTGKQNPNRERKMADEYKKFGKVLRGNKKSNVEKSDG
jgi:hypothetical protein